MSDTILAIDLGRYKSVACVYSRSTCRHAFRTLDTTPAELDKLLAHPPGRRGLRRCEPWATPNR